MNKHAWLNELKKRGRATQRELNYGKNQDKEVMDTSHFIVHREARTQVIAIVDQLGEACKKILLMFYYENLSMKEILEKTKYETEQVVRNKKYKCLKQLEQMLNEKQFLLGNRPLFVDFDLYGMLGNFLYSGHYELPAAHTQLRGWYQRMNAIKHGAQ